MRRNKNLSGVAVCYHMVAVEFERKKNLHLFSAKLPFIAPRPSGGPCRFLSLDVEIVLEYVCSLMSYRYLLPWDTTHLLRLSETFVVLST